MARITWTFIALAALLALLPTATACNKAVPPGFTELGDWEPEVRFYLKSEGTKTFLSESVEGGAASFQAASMSATSGPGSWANGLQGKATDYVDFALEKPMASNRWLNLSKPVVGTLYWTSTVQGTAGRADPQLMRFEIFQGEQRVGGFEKMVEAGEARTGYYSHNFCFRPETRVLEAGQVLKVRVTRLVSTADITLGTGGSQASFVEFRYFDSDPLVGALYLEKGKLLKAPSAESPPTGSDGSPLPILLGLFALPLVMRPRGGRAAILALVLLTGGLAGCMGGEPKGETGESGGPQPSASVTYEDLPPTGTTGAPGPETGAIEGTVVDPIGIPVKDASVLVIGTSAFMSTNSTGGFRFNDLPPNTYTVRVDKTGFVSFEGPIEVIANKVAKPTITLTYPVNKQANDRPHFHDDWNGETEKTIMNGPITPTWSYQDPTGARTSGTATKAPVSVFVPGGTSRSEACPGYGGCTAALRLPANAYVLPGSREIEITLTWTGTGVVRELGLTAQSPVNITAASYVPRESGKPFRIAIFPNEADFGHQKYTDWILNLITPISAPEQPFTSPLNLMGQIGVKVRVFKGVVPYEPPHVDLWGNQTVLPILTSVSRGGTCLNCDYPQYHTDAMWALSSITPFTTRIPGDSKEVRGVLSWTGGGTGALATPWALVYRAANFPSHSEYLSQYPKPDEVKASAGKYEFTIKLEEGEADQFYQKYSKWIFFIDDGDLPAKGVTVSPTTEWKLTVTAHR